jgi:hypothetical protein
MNRNLLFAAITAAALIATFIHGVFTGEPWLPRWRFGRVYVRVVCIVLIFIHIPGAIAARIFSAKMMPRVFNTFYSTIEPPADTSLKDKTLIVVNAPNPFMFLALPALNAWNDKPLPEKIRLIAPGFGPTTITRTDPNTLVVSSQQQNLFTVQTEKRYYQPHLPYIYENFTSLFRSKDAPFQPGHIIELPDMTIEVLRTDQKGIPAEIRATFHTFLENPDNLWLQWNWAPRGTGQYSIFTTPAIGESISLAGPE